MNVWLRKCNLRIFLEQETCLWSCLHNICHLYHFAGLCESRYSFNETGEQCHVWGVTFEYYYVISSFLLACI
jgi:hypothetical protein